VPANRGSAALRILAAPEKNSPYCDYRAVTSANFDLPTKKSRTKRFGVGKPCERDKDDILLNRPDDAPTAAA
jgi:hypothetical protein